MLKEKNISQSMIEKIQKYEEDFAKIQAATQIKDFEQLITIFIKNEEKVHLPLILRTSTCSSI